jgi:hypothetical protein
MRIRIQLINFDEDPNADPVAEPGCLNGADPSGCGSGSTTHRLILCSVYRAYCAEHTVYCVCVQGVQCRAGEAGSVPAEPGGRQGAFSGPSEGRPPGLQRSARTVQE